MGFRCSIDSYSPTILVCTNFTHSLCIESGSLCSKIESYLCFRQWTICSENLPGNLLTFLNVISTALTADFSVGTETALARNRDEMQRSVCSFDTGSMIKRPIVLVVALGSEAVMYHSRLCTGDDHQRPVRLRCLLRLRPRLIFQRKIDASSSSTTSYFRIWTVYGKYQSLPRETQIDRVVFLVRDSSQQSLSQQLAFVSLHVFHKIALSRL